MSFSEAFKVVSSRKETENGGVAFSSTGSDVLNLFSMVGALRSRDDAEIIQMYDAARHEDKELADSIVLYSRNIREEGCGERRVGRILLKRLAELDPQKVIRNFDTIVKNGRWDDLFCLFDTPVEDKMILFLLKNLEQDIHDFAERKPISLLAKWMPSIKTSSKETVRRAKKICRFAGIQEKDYRKTLSGLRSYLRITEKLMSQKQWNEIDFETVPSVAMNRYMAAFHRNCGERFLKYIDEVKEGKKKINASVLFPYNIIESMDDNNSDKELLEEQWKALPNYLDKPYNVICMCDTSGSMYWADNGRPLSTSIGLGIYFAQHNTGDYHGLYMTFSEKPSLIKIDENVPLWEIVQDAKRRGRYNTNLDAAFQEIFALATIANDAPAALIVISDMEIDNYKESSFGIVDKWEKKFTDAGLKMPKLILWNVEARHDTFLSTKFNKNVAFISGSSASTFSHLTDLIENDSYTAMKKILSLPQFQWN